MPRVIAANRIPRVPIPSKGIASPVSAGGGGGAGGVGSISFFPSTFAFGPVTLAANPFTTINASPVVSVAQTAHGYSVGQQVVISNSTAVGGITPVGAVTIAMVAGPNQWSFIWGLNATSGATGGGLPTVQNLAALAPPIVPGAVYEDALSMPPPRSISQFPALYSVLPTLGGKNFAVNPNLNSAAGFKRMQSVLWNGAIWSIQGGNASVFRAATPFSPDVLMFTLPIVPGGTGGTRTVSLSATPSKLFVVAVDSGGTVKTAIATISSDTTISPFFVTGIGADGQPYHVSKVLDVGGGIYIALRGNSAGPIFRTTDNGVTWTTIAGVLSNPAERVWGAIWKSGATIFMIGQAGAIATSTDNGATWAVNAAVPGAQNMNQVQVLCGYGALQVPTIWLDLNGRKGYGVTQSGGGMIQWDLDNPTAGVTQIAANGTFTANGQFLAFFQTPYGLYVGDISTNIKPGLWVATWAAPTVWTQLATSFQLPVVNSTISQVPALYYAVGQGLDFGDGLLTFMNVDAAYGGGSPPTTASWQIANAINTFDRLVIADPNVPGKKPFIRVS